jgi:hypothetical protein
VEFVADKVARGQIFSEYFGFHRLFHIHHLASVAGTIGQLVAGSIKWIQSHPTPRNLKEKDEHAKRMLEAGFLQGSLETPWNLH